MSLKIGPELVALIEAKLTKALNAHKRIMTSTNSTAYKAQVGAYLTEAMSFLQSWPEAAPVYDAIKEVLSLHNFVSQPQMIRVAKDKFSRVETEIAMAIELWKDLTNEDNEAKKMEDLLMNAKSVRVMNPEEIGNVKPQGLA